MTSFHFLDSVPDCSDAVYEHGIPRYAEPDFIADEPKEGMCFNCEHRVTVELGGTKYDLCVQERDDRRGGQLGDVYEADRDQTECCNWDWNGSWESWEDVYGIRPD
jgi:hypothetical protein